MKDYCAGIDIGGTKVAVALFDADMRMAAKTVFPTASTSGCEQLVEKALSELWRLCDENGIPRDDIASVGIASPGPLDGDAGVIVDVHTLGYKNEPILSYVRERADLPCALVKDTNAAVYYESMLGRGKDDGVVVYITLSTGVGSGLCINKQLVTGAGNCAGELGHMVVVKGGRKCGCGSEGCLEAYASGTAIARIASERLGRAVDCKETFRLAAEGNAVAAEVIADAGEHIGYAMSAVCQMIDPAVIVFGGSVTRDFEALRPHIEKSFARYAEKLSGRVTRVELSDPNGDQTVCGAAIYGKRCGK